MLTDPRAALAEQNCVVHALLGLAGLARLVRALAAGGEHRPGPAEPADDLVHLLLAVVSLGDAVGRLGAPDPTGGPADRPPTATGSGPWLR